jgi:hypothetical protein
MLPDSICLPVPDDQYPDDKAGCCSNQSTHLVPDVAQVHQTEL